VANAYIWLRNDTIAPALLNAFYQARLAGATVDQLRNNVLYPVAGLPPPVTVGAILTYNNLINVCLATMARIIAETIFVSRQDVELIKTQIVADFAPAEECAADNFDEAGYQSLVSLHAAVTNHLVSTARPLPRVVPYQFFGTLSTLLIAQRLYADPSRADEIRVENKIVHPAFCPRLGIALSA
jgi:prophage DNA circulation protein